MPGLARVALVAVACTLLVPAAAQAAPATLKGKLTGVKLPAAGKGVASVQAMGVSSGVLVAARYAGRKGGFSLRVPAGSYGVLAAVVPFRGSKLIEKVVGRLRLKAGKTRSVKLAVKKAKKKKKRKHRRRMRRAQRSQVPDGFGDVTVDYPAIAIHPFQVSDPEIGQLSKGIAQMLITDLLTTGNVVPPCKAVLVERMRLDPVLDELRRSKGPAFDKGTRPKTGKIVRDNAKVTGTIERANGQMTITATYTDLKTGTSTSFTETGLDGDFFDMEKRLAERLAKHICDPPPPPNPVPEAYGGTVGGTWTTQVTGEEWTYTGSVELAYTGDSPAPPPGAPPGTYRTFQVTSGSASISVTIDPPFDDCGLTASDQPVQLDPGASGQLWVEADSTPAYFIGLMSVGKSITATRTGPPECNPGSTTSYPIPGIWVQTTSAHTSASTTLIGEETVATPETPFDYDTSSNWNLAPR